MDWKSGEARRPYYACMLVLESRKGLRLMGLMTAVLLLHAMVMIFFVHQQYQLSGEIERSITRKERMWNHGGNRLLGVNSDKPPRSGEALESDTDDSKMPYVAQMPVAAGHYTNSGTTLNGEIQLNLSSKSQTQKGSSRTATNRVKRSGKLLISSLMGNSTNPSSKLGNIVPEKSSNTRIQNKGNSASLVHHRSKHSPRKIGLKEGEFEETNMEHMKTDEEWQPEEDWLMENLIVSKPSKSRQKKRKH